MTMKPRIGCRILAGGVLTAMCAAGLSAAGLDPAELPIMGADEEVVADEHGWSHVRWASFDQDKVVSLNGYQYGVYWDENRLLAVARRDLDGGGVEVIRFEQYVLAEGMPEGQQRNGHRNVVVGMSPGDGRLHLSWDHHNNDLNYTRSREGFLTDPPEEMSVDDFEPKQHLTEDALQRVTYPRFFNDHENNLYFYCRTGGSGRGDSVFFEYHHDDGEWELISDRLLSREGVYELWNNSESRNAYMHDILFDDNGRLHITWVYREAGRTWASNHDLHYAYSDDQGRTWKNNDGEVIADTREGERISIDSPGIVVWEIPVFSWLMNQCAMTLDSNNNPHVATYHMEEPFEPEDLQHNPPLDEKHRLNYYHYWRDNDGEWHRSAPLPLPLPRQRPMIVAAPDDTLIMYFSTPDGFVGYVARAEDQWSEWTSFRLTGPEWDGGTSKPDRRMLQEENILSFSAAPLTQGDGNGMGFLDFSVERILDFAARQAE